MLMTLANGITFARLVLTLGFFVAAARHAMHWGIILFAVAWALDMVDGFAARVLHQETRAGYFLDKLVDRLLLVGAIVVLVILQYLAPMALLLLIKDVLVLPRVWQRWRAGAGAIDLGYLGKLVTVLQGAAVLWLYFGLPYPAVMVVFVATLGAYAAWQFSHIPAEQRS